MFKVNAQFATFFVLVLAFISLVGQAKEPKKVAIEITYEDESHPPLKIETDWREGLSALEALQFVAEVKTHPLGEYVFVSAINGVEGAPNKSVWYYRINGVPATKIAINQPLKNGDVLTWIYKSDVCSAQKKR